MAHDPLTNEQINTVRAFLREHSTLALATVNAGGQPEVAPLFYLSVSLTLYWLSSPKSRHSVNLSVHPQVAATIYPAVWGWQDIRGVQIEGFATTIDDADERNALLTSYRAKFNIPSELDAQITTSTLYRLNPTWIRWLDNSVRMGYKAESPL
jgi:uncharacterized protein